MDKKTVLIFILILAGLATAGLFRSSYTVDDSAGAEGTHRAAPYDREFYDTVYSFKKKTADLGGRSALAGVVPHHLLAGDLIAEFYSNLAGEEPDLVVLIGPNHYGAGESVFISSDYGWDTPFGTLKCDRSALAELKEALGAGIDPEAVNADHSMTSQAGFIKKTFPKAGFVPIMLKSEVKADEAARLAAALESLARKRKTFVIASIDFSHYQDGPTAAAHDRAAIAALAEADFGAVYALDIDSPPSLYALMKYGELKGAEFTLLNNSNSARLAGKEDIDSTTSYVTGYFLAPIQELTGKFFN
ncbi:AmmeMemoRadiSam system protein B [Candidatus Falkowbacteria bacterium RIFOXYB2_FULL_47_14]|uniref:AmmeMemoRadiSam system protein B n=1 Tax=Candidatus Falkowbacteria bacterium RIFOXYA2_FULL_47_19 TaxID=1797994 RepID=A0A1F5SEF8_9BACT|nr:MAG: AmmeMemoRadiSam system protein B [Candidatus Falkowbacteria bacterium RIFOXYA2_FULL_47_19]OGF35338.1 MAG: AmmeMemoRadiSam system protein B [Candidatus Falkowbacteria bacterium RIFOXYC2_FULL_46_15]OGF43780.1 MAG: AmmeMemoRadiSam system protein B [Candidatus Falkowbacteria bacterium RIFOXYB2_FULL_47_14]